MSCTRRDAKTEHLVARTFFSGSRFFIADQHTHLRVAQVWDVLHLCASEKSSTHNMFHRPLLDVPDPCPSFCFTPPPSTQTSLPMTGIRRSLLRRHTARRISVWPPGRTYTSHTSSHKLACLREESRQTSCRVVNSCFRGFGNAVIGGRLFALSLSCTGSGAPSIMSILSTMASQFRDHLDTQ